MASTTAFTSQTAYLTALPPELLFSIFHANVPSPSSSLKDVRTYFHSHGLSTRLRDAATTAFCDKFIFEIDLDIHCHHTHRAHFHTPFYRSSGIEKSPFAKHIKKANLNVQCLHSKFAREVLEETIRTIKQLRQRTALKELCVTFMGADDGLSRLIGEGLGAEFRDLKFVDFGDGAVEENVDVDVAIAEWQREWKRLEPLHLGEKDQDEGNERPSKRLKSNAHSWRWCRKERMWKLSAK